MLTFLCAKKAAMLQKTGRKISAPRQQSAKHLAELRKQHTDGELLKLQPRIRKHESRKRFESANTSEEVNMEQKMEQKRSHSQSSL